MRLCGRDTARRRCWLAKRTLWRAIERMENRMEGKGIVIVKEDSLLASRLHSIIPRSLRCLLSEVAILNSA